MNSSNKKPGILLPPAVGYSFNILKNLCKNNSISLRYYPRLIIITLINLINLPFRTYERLFINPRFKNVKIDNHPIFIIGHWRSGTTHLHNLLCKDPQMGYTTTYQSVFPDTLFNIVGRFIFKNITGLLIPAKREGDNVKLGSSFPQEEEFALGDKTPISFYYFWMFPKKIINYYNSYVRFIGIPKIQLENWINDYKLLIKKALKNTNGVIFLSKNPTNTARIKILLLMFPNAKFIHIHRYPVEVFLSTRNFFKNMIPHLQLESITQNEVDDSIVSLYKNLMNDYFEQEKYIPEGNLINVSFDELEQNPEEVLRNIYKTLDINGYNNAEPYFNKYIKQQGTYKKNNHLITKYQLQLVEKEYEFSLQKLNYNKQQNLEVIDE